VAALRPRRHVPPTGWPAETFERVTDSIAAALLAAVRRAADESDATVETVERESIAATVSAWRALPALGIDARRCPLTGR
jgi:hypothetical protein